MDSPAFNRNTAEPRLAWLDVARVLACLCVLIIHVYYPNGGGGHLSVAIYNYYAIPCASDLFFMISGALMLWHPQQTMPFFRRRWQRVLAPMLIWSVVVMLINVGLDRLEWKPFWQRIALLPVQPQVPQYWFVYCLTGLYALTPALSTWLAQCRRREVEVLLALWALSLCLPLTAALWPDTLTALDVQHGWLYYFHGYAGFYLMGYYLRRWAGRLPLWAILTATVVLASMPLWIRVGHLNSALLMHRLSPTMAGLTLCVFALLMRLETGTRWAARWHTLARGTYITYLAHMPLIMFVLRPLVAPWQWNYTWGIPLLSVVVFAVCSAVAALLRRLPGSQWLGAA